MIHIQCQILWVCSTVECTEPLRQVPKMLTHLQCFHAFKFFYKIICCVCNFSNAQLSFVVLTVRPEHQKSKNLVILNYGSCSLVTSESSAVSCPVNYNTLNIKFVTNIFLDENVIWGVSCGAKMLTYESCWCKCVDFFDLLFKCHYNYPPWRSKLISVKYIICAISFL